MNREIKPVSDPAFWEGRIYKFVAAGGQLHQIIYDNSLDVWTYLQDETAGILRRVLLGGERLLDAGCGYGALVGCLEQGGFGRERAVAWGRRDVVYTGVDVSPELLRLARNRYPARWFVGGDLRALPFRDKEFDWAVARSIKKMIEDNLGYTEWQKMERELRRVAHHLLILDYPAVVGEPIPYGVISGNQVRQYSAEGRVQ
jgi:SAM-dependent methyltransferase